VPALAERRAVHFGADCAAWHYPGTNGACIVMAGGLAVTRGPGTDRFARRFHAAGFSVLAFDFRTFGDSGGEPRQVARIPEQLADWDAALQHAASLPGVRPTGLVAWGFSLAGGHVFRLAVRHPDLAGAIAQAPLADGAASLPTAMHHTTPGAMARLMARAVADAAGGLVGRPPRLVPLVGERGTVALLSSPDARRGPDALDPDGRYPDWQQTVAARTALRLGTYRPGRAASRIRCPLLVVAYEDDEVASPTAAARAARKAPRGELVELSGGHYGAFLDEHDATFEAELAFLHRQIGAPPT
jgi:uncharacterized protein